jgi:hypothetical protein
MCIRLMLLVVCLAGALFGQGRYVFRHEFNLSGAAGVWTIQQPASGGNRLNARYVTISTSSALKITFERACTTPASSTAGTILRNPPEYTTVAAKATAFHTSNASGCTVVWGPIDIPAGAGVTIDFDPLTDYLVGSGTTRNLTIRTATATATGSINWHFEEIAR